MDEAAVSAMLQVLADAYSVMIWLGSESCRQYLQGLQLTWAAVVFSLVKQTADEQIGKATHLLVVTCVHKAVLLSQASPNVLKDMFPGLFGACYKVCTSTSR